MPLPYGTQGQTHYAARWPHYLQQLQRFLLPHVSVPLSLLLLLPSCGGGHSHPACPHNHHKKWLALKEALVNHPNPDFVNFLVKDFSGFHPGLSPSHQSLVPVKSLVSSQRPRCCWQPARQRSLGGFHNRTLPYNAFPPFFFFCISPLGITEHSGKKHIIIDLSATQGSLIRT